ncbi:DNA polymerase subunit Cdc27-domain-containing protein [Flagelloscypha sp. PMI_526]|nr:DNA polymerase subunit Cdc27-domain-containing protein [Flagelloscypha sp. PMI_526]
MAPPPKAQLTPDEFLLRNLVARKSIITYRSLSRDLEIHVNDAKTALAEFHTKHQDEKIFATYMVCGFTKQGEETMDVDDEDSEPVRNLEAILTAEKDLDQTKARLEKVTSVWMYCLSPSQLRDPGVMSETVDHVRQIDGSKDFEFAQSLGSSKEP